MRHLRVTVLAALLALLSGTASAQTTWSAMQSFGLTGTWSASCKDPASPANGWLTYYQDTSGVVRRTFDRGPGQPSLMVTVDSAKIITSTTIAARFRNDDPNWGNQNGISVDLALIKENGHVRTLSSTGSDGKQYIKDGVVVSSGTAIPWLEKCKI